MQKREQTIQYKKIAIYCAVFFLTPFFTHAANLLFSPSSASYEVGETFNVRAEVAPDGDSVNAVETGVSFDTDVLSVVSVSKEGSVFTLWTTEPEFSNTGGTITFGGGSPTPFSRNATLLTITFRAKAAGEATVGYNGGSVLAADGLGTDVLNETRTSTYTITEAVLEPEPEPEPEPTSDGPAAPVVESPSHPEEDSWYAEDTAEFSWDIPNGVTSVRLLLGTRPESTPTVPYTPPIDTRIIDNLDEGVSYLHVQFENDAGWGAITHRKVQIDYTPPEEFEIEVVEAQASTTPPSLKFVAGDATSGIERYEIVVESEEPIVLMPDELAALPNGAWEMPRLFDGTYFVSVTAYDLAGNERQVDASVTLETGYVEDTGEEEVVAVEEDSGASILWIFISVFLLITVLLLVGVIVMQRNRLIKERDYLRRETREIRDRMEKIFTVLQDELEEQINSMDGKPRLSPSEKRVLKSLREALEVSEAFINKEIEDVEKILQ